MNLDEYLKLAALGAPVIVITPVDDGPIVAHTWQATVLDRAGWEYVLADYHGKILGQAWIAGDEGDRDQDIAATIARLSKRIAAASKVA